MLQVVSEGAPRFSRHRRTGTDHAPIDRVDCAKLRHASDEKMHHGIIEKGSSDHSKWEFIMRVPMRFNRPVLLRRWLWHTAGLLFGNRMENARRGNLMFLSSARS